MPCRVGITTRPNERKEAWRNSVIGFKNWRELHKCQKKETAQNYEQRYAKQWGCKAHPGGADANGPWYVYYFEYTREK